MQPSRFDDASPVFPDGLSIRRMRHSRGWSRRDLCTAIAHASRRATGIGEAVSPNLIAGIEERGETVSYTTLCLIASGLDCNPVEILQP